MVSITIERDHLAQAARHILEGEERVRHQRALVARLADHGHDVSMPELVLETMQTSLVLMKGHYELIERTITAAEK
jgi:hypothetical protein